MKQVLQTSYCLRLLPLGSSNAVATGEQGPPKACSRGQTLVLRNRWQRSYHR